MVVHLAFTNVPICRWMLLFNLWNPSIMLSFDLLPLFPQLSPLWKWHMWYLCILHHKLHGSQFGIIIMRNLFFIGSYGIDMNVIHLLELFEHQCCEHCFDTNVIYLFILFRHICYMSIHVVYTWKSCTWLPCLNNAWHSCLNNMHPWNKVFRTNLERTHEAHIFVMCLPTCTNVGIVDGATLPLIIFWAIFSILSYSFLTFDLETESTFLSSVLPFKNIF